MKSYWIKSWMVQVRLTDEVSALLLAEMLEPLLPLPRKRKKELQEDLHRLINLRSKQ